VVTDDAERAPWDRRADESAASYAAFRVFRDLGPLRQLAAVVDRLDAPVAAGTVRRWSGQHDWRARAVAWDDERHRIEDRERLEALRTMHRNHQRAGRAVAAVALRALEALDVTQLSGAEVARLLDLGTRLERSTLVSSVEQLQGVPSWTDDADPWETIAQELSAGEL
jgi:hypothetical protein